jgi:uncharacterized membrane protein
MWIVQHLPDWVFHTLFFLSLTATLLGFFLGQVKYIKQYTLLLKLSGIIGLVLAILLEGALLDNKIWQERVAEVEAKLAKAEAAGVKVNSKINDKVANKQQKIIVYRQGRTEYITREITKYDKTCVVPTEMVKALNAAAKDEELK